MSLETTGFSSARLSRVVSCRLVPTCPMLDVAPRNLYFRVLFFRSDDEDLENFFRQFFGQFNHPRDERSNGSHKHAKPKKRKKKR